jgi:MoaA/NifB/PqqE/SkfB family radical SAM enzyme
MDFKKELLNHPGLIERLARLCHDPLAATPILSAKIKLLWGCNLSCRFCQSRRENGIMDRAAAHSILQGLTKQGLRKIHFSGGEIFRHPDVFDIIADACSMGLQVNLTTNATLLDKGKIRRLADAPVHGISISLDSADPAIHDGLRGQKGVFKAALKAAQYIAGIKKGRPRLRINTVVTAKNAVGLDALFSLIKTLGPSVGWKLIPVDTTRKSLLLPADTLARLAEEARSWDILDDNFPFGRNGADFEDFSKGRYGCRGGGIARRCFMPWLQLFIDPHGYYYPCCMSRGRIGALGRYPAQSLRDISEGDASRALKMSMASGCALKICRSCDDFIRENRAVEELIKEQTQNHNPLPLSGNI